MGTNHKNRIPLDSFKRTKIVATVGPATHSESAIYDMLTSGVNGFRLNFSHGTNEERIPQIRWIRKASKKYGDKPAAVIADLQGPKIRLGDFDGFIPIQSGQSLTFKYKGEYVPDGPIPTQFDLSKKVKRGERVLLYDGRIKTIVQSVKDGLVHVRAENDGVVTQRKGINLPDTDFGGDVITAKDRKDIAFIGTQDVDYVAMSFVQSAKDVKKIKTLLKNQNSEARVIAKIETKAAVENIEEIILESDAVMVARGDLAIETEPEAVPIVQRQIVGKCMEYGKLSIVATQMLVSMTEELEPTRAEVSDVATAVIVGADAVMLSEETAMGKYPIETIQMMKRIIVHTQRNAPLKPVFFKEEDNSIQSAISSAMITLATQVEAKAIVAESKSGATARSISAHRPSMPIFMLTSSRRVAQQLAIVYGGKSFVRPDSQEAGLKLKDFLFSQGVFKKGDVAVFCWGMQPGQIGGTDTIKVRKLG